MSDHQFVSKVYRGDRLGRAIGFPTINLDVDVIEGENLKKGVYGAQVFVEGEEYTGVMYYGPRLVLGETKDVLEIHILDFEKDIYEKQVRVRVGRFVRGVMDFESMEAMQKQLKKDVKEVRKDSKNQES